MDSDFFVAGHRKNQKLSSGHACKPQPSPQKRISVIIIVESQIMLGIPLSEARNDLQTY